MPIPAKDIIFRLMDRIEEMYIENLILRDELRHMNQEALNQVIQDAKNSPKLKSKVASLFAATRAALLQESLQEEALLESLRAVPPIDVKDMN